jgi:hypothetical protein
MNISDENVAVPASIAKGAQECVGELRNIYVRIQKMKVEASRQGVMKISHWKVCVKNKVNLTLKIGRFQPDLVRKLVAAKDFTTVSLKLREELKNSSLVVLRKLERSF